MTGQRPSRQELIRRRRRNGFIGRQGELAAFKDALKQSPEESLQFLFHIHGPAGVGKSTLVRQLETAARETEALTAYVDESVADVVETMESVSLQLAQQGAPLKGFDKLLATYRQRRHEADAAAAETAPASAEATRGDQALAGPGPSPSSMIVSQIGLVGLGMIPGVGALTGAVDPSQVAAGADRMKAILSTRLRSHDDVQLVLSPVQTLTPVFLEELTDVARRRQWVVLFFDTYERTGQLLDTWLRNILVSDRFGELPANVLVVLAGQRPMDSQCWGDWLDLVTDLPLEVFTESEARQFLATKGVTDERVIEVILQLSGKLPVLVSTLAEARPTSAAEVGDPSGTAVERFLKWETDPARRATALACALPQELNEDIFRLAVEGEETSELFGWLCSMPFVTNRAGHFHYHDVVRRSMLRLQRQQSPTRWQEQHTRLVDAFQQRRAQLESVTGSAGEQWDDERWRGYRLQETYHRLCADPLRALPQALRELVDAYGHQAVSLRRWVQTLAQASEDSADPTMSRWAEDLLSALDDSRPGATAMSLLLARGRLDIQGKHLAHTLRGRDYRNAKQYEHALIEYNTALALESDGARALYGRGVTHNRMGVFDEALADFTRAIEIDPAYEVAIAYRGNTYDRMERFDEALADYTRAIELDPASTWSLTCRGNTYRTMERFDEALADYTRAIELGPENVHAVTNRGLTYRLTGQYDEALADLTRTIELNPDNARALTLRGNIYRLTGQYDEALADLTRTIELDPDNAWSHYEMAIALHVAQNPDRDAHLMQSVALLAPDSLGMTPRATADIGNLLLTHCALSRWEKAQSYLEDFANNDPTLGDVNELLAAINSLAQVMPSVEERASVFRRRLEEVVTPPDRSVHGRDVN